MRYLLHRLGGIKRPYNVDCLFCEQEKNDDGFCKTCPYDPTTWWKDLQSDTEDFPVEDRELSALEGEVARAFELEAQCQMHGHPLQNDLEDFRLLKIITDERNKYETNKAEDQRQELERKSKQARSRNAR